MSTPGLALVTLCTALLAGPALAASIERTDPQHLRPIPPRGYDLPLSPPVVRYPLPSQYVTIRKDKDWRKAGRFDRELSTACAQRRFTEDRRMRFRAVFKGEILGVAYGNGLNLRDPEGLADPSMIYLFRNGDSAGCSVLKTTSLDDPPPAAAPPPAR